MTDDHVTLTSVSLDELPSLVGATLGPSGAADIPQIRIDTFADATDDHQWIHVDPERAAAGPFGTTIAHGYLTLSLGPALLWQLLDVPDAASVVNYGLDKVRFPAPVPVGSKVRMTAEVRSVDEVSGGLQLAYRGTFHADGLERPVCVADGLLRYYRGGQ